MADIRTFAPGYGTGVTISASTTSSNTEIRPGSLSVCVTNKDNNHIIYFRTTPLSTDVATEADYIVMPGNQISVSKALDDDRIAIVAESGTPSVHVIIGDGI